MNPSRIIVVILFMLVLALPLLLRQTIPAASGAHSAARDPRGERQKLIIITPHIEQIRDEFGTAFADWNARHFPDEPPVEVDWRAPGGTTEILKLLMAVYQARLKQELTRLSKDDPSRLLATDMRLPDLFLTGSIDFDLVFGGGSYDHSRLKDPKNVSTWFKPFISRGVEPVTLLAPKDKLSDQSLAASKDIVTSVRIGGSTLLLRVPLDAIQAPADNAVASPASLLAPLAHGADSVECRVDLSRLEREASVRMSVHAGFSQDQMREWFGSDSSGAISNSIGSGQLFQDDRAKSKSPDDWQYWIGTALSGFGIVYNADLLGQAAIPHPSTFADLCDFRYFRRLSLADPRQSGSVATLYDSILNQAVHEAIVTQTVLTGSWHYRFPAVLTPQRVSGIFSAAADAGWIEGWRIIREMCANAHSFSSASTFPPMVVSQGEALAGVCIDFYGRGQAQAVLEPGQLPESGRVGYIDPPGRVYIDADPASILLGGPNPKLARRFVEFCLSPEGQALWQFPPTTTQAGASNPPIPESIGHQAAVTQRAETQRRMGPRDNALRRLPSRPDMYRSYITHFVDQTNPFAIASPARQQGWRDGMIAIMGALIDVSDDLRPAWQTLNRARTDPSFDHHTLAEMERLFYAMPATTCAGNDGSPRSLIFSPEHYKAISTATNRWRDPIKAAQARIEYAAFFQDHFRRVRDLAR